MLSRAFTTPNRVIRAARSLLRIFLHIFINLGGIFGIIPLTGIPLPFLSYGGTYALTLIIALAIVQRINIETKRSKLTI